MRRHAGPCVPLIRRRIHSIRGVAAFLLAYSRVSRQDMHRDDAPCTCDVPSVPIYRNSPPIKIHACMQGESRRGEVYVLV
jgi:hypothetical protein